MKLTQDECYIAMIAIDAYRIKFKYDPGLFHLWRDLQFVFVEDMPTSRHLTQAEIDALVPVLKDWSDHTDQRTYEIWRDLFTRVDEAGKEIKL